MESPLYTHCQPETTRTHLDLLTSDLEPGNSSRVEDALAIAVTLTEAESETEKDGPRTTCDGRGRERGRERVRMGFKEASRMTRGSWVSCCTAVLLYLLYPSFLVWTEPPLLLPLLPVSVSDDSTTHA